MLFVGSYKEELLLDQKKMNDLVYVMYNLKLKSRQIKKKLLLDLSFEDMESYDEWITKEGDHIFL